MMTTTQQASWVGFDLGGTKMLAKAYTSDFKELSKVRKKTRGYQGQDKGLDRIIKTIEETLESAGATSSDLKGIGIGAPGAIRIDDGVIVESSNLGWKNVKIVAALKKAFGCPVVLCNDVDAGVYGEYTMGAARGSRCVIGAFLGTGIGGGCIYEGRILRGKEFSAMEIGHFPAFQNGLLCGCGRRGCLETVGGRLAIARECAVAAYRGDAPWLMEHVGTDIREIKSSSIRDAIEQGDKAIENIVIHAAHAVGRVLGGIVNLIGPDTIVLGGGLAEALPDLLTREVAKGIKQNACPAYGDTVKVVAAQLSDDAAVLGAAAWAEKSITS
jgi:glucokinase